MSEAKLNIATLGTRETVNQVSATVAVVTGANALSVVAVTFEKAFVTAPKVVAVCAKTTGLRKGILSVDTVTTTGMNVNIFQINSGDVATGDHVVDVTLVGWKVS